MDQGSVTWIVSADANEARIFCERRRSGALTELPELRMQAGEAERRRRAADDQGDHGAELRFLRRVASRLSQAARGGSYDRLALMGPPRALGLLRLALPAEIARRVDVTDAHARKQDDPEALRRHLRNARARTWS